MTKTITIKVHNILNDKGEAQLIVCNEKEWAGMKRRHNFKKEVIVHKELASITIKIKTK